jgi:DMSO reductase family type II enzyme chaperone
MTPTDELVQRAAWFKTFSLLFRYPNDEIIEILKLNVAELPDGVLNSELRSVIAPFKRAVADSNSAEFASEYSSLFTGAGLCRANENDYEKLSFSMTEKLADVAGFYSAFGLDVKDDTGERPDFIGTELDFINLLLLKQAYAVKNGWTEQAEISVSAYADFLEAHFIKWIPKFCYALAELSEKDGIYAGLADALAALVETESRRLELSSS